MHRWLPSIVVAFLLGAPAALAAPPAPPSGRLLVLGFQRAWVVSADGRAVPLAHVGAASWSARLGLVAVTSDGRLMARTARGATVWARTSARLLGAPRWSSAAPVRLAFLSGRSVHVVDGEGTHERALGRARAVSPAWRPGIDQIAFVRPGGDVVVVGGATGRTLARWHPPKDVAGLSWTGDGTRLVVSLRYAIAVLDAQLRPQWSQRTPSILSAVAAPAGALFGLATVKAKPDGSQDTIVELRNANVPAFRVRLARAYVLTGRIVWAPDARALMIERPLERGMLLVDVRTRRGREVELPRRLRPVTGGIVAWFR